MCSDDQIELIRFTSDAIMNFKLPSLSHGNFQTLSNIKTDEFTEHFNLTHRVTTRNALDRIKINHTNFNLQQTLVQQKTSQYWCLIERLCFNFSTAVWVKN